MCSKEDAAKCLGNMINSPCHLRVGVPRDMGNSPCRWGAYVIGGGGHGDRRNSTDLGFTSAPGRTSASFRLHPFHGFT